MHYLKCIALLEHLQKQLYAGQRKQVDVNVIPQIEQSIKGLQILLKDESLPAVMSALNDVMHAIINIKSTPNLLYLTDSMKQVIVESLQSMEGELCAVAFEYFKVNDFEPNDQINNVMRKVVEVALERGLL